MVWYLTEALGPIRPHIKGVPAVVRPGREADHAPPSSAEVGNAWR
jgi:hypothetical protein